MEMTEKSTAHWADRAVIYEMNVRQLTEEGTLRAAKARLNFLRDMGIDIVWLMPIFPIGVEDRKGTLGSAYSIRDYTAVNPDTGTVDDVKAFVRRAHELGMYVLLDWVANHTARDARWITEKPADWYERDAEGRPAVPWDWTDTAKLNYANREVWRGQIEAMRFWLACGIDGFRCDMAMLVPFDFWREAAAELRAVRPDLYMLAEAEEPYLFEDGVFDACYGWKFHHLMGDLAQGKCRLWPLRDCLRRDDFPRTAVRMTFTSNHDENAWSDTEQVRMGAAVDILTALTFLWPQGLPLIYTGQEVDYAGRFSLFERQPIPEECYHRTPRTDFYARLASLRHDNPALGSRTGGEPIDIRNNAEDCLLSIVREVEGNRVFAELNLSPWTIQADYDCGIYAGDYEDGLTGERVSLPRHIDRIMAPWSFRILVQQTQTRTR